MDRDKKSRETLEQMLGKNKGIEAGQSCAALTRLESLQAGSNSFAVCTSLSFPASG